MVGKPDIVKKLLEEEKLGTLESSLQGSHEGLEVLKNCQRNHLRMCQIRASLLWMMLKKMIFTKNQPQNGNLSSNESVGGILGYRPEELIGMNSMDIISKECQDGTETNFNNLPKTGEIPSETVLLDKKEQPHFVEYSFTVIKESSVLKYS
jgi:PAS domain S-box-containing protein